MAFLGSIARVYDEWKHPEELQKPKIIGESICNLDQLEINNKKTLTIQGRFRYGEEDRANAISIDLKYVTQWITDACININNVYQVGDLLAISYEDIDEVKIQPKEKVNDDESQETVQLLIFWASWAPDHSDLKLIDEIAQKNEDAWAGKVEISAMSLDASTKNIEEFLQLHKTGNYLNHYHIKNNKSKLDKDFDIKGEVPGRILT